MLKLLFFLPSLAGGGAERTILNLANSVDRNVFSVTLLLINQVDNGLNKDEYSKYLKEDVKLINLGIDVRKNKYLSILIATANVIKNLKPDVVMSTMYKANLLMFVATKLSRFKGRLILREATNRSVYKPSLFEKRLIKYIYCHANATIALSEGVKNDLVDYFDVDSNNITVIYNPIDIDGIKKRMVENVELEPSFTIVAAGRLITAKDYPTMLKAVRMLSIPFHLYILGKGPLEENLLSQINELELNGKVTLLGFQDNPYKYFRAADLFLLTSAWEGFGHVIVEAMSCETCVLCTNCNYGPAEIISDGINGFIVPVGDYKRIAEKIEYLYNNPNIISKVGEEAGIQARKYDVETIVKQYESVFLNRNR